ncbi:MAG: hypothetical protein JSU58_02320 [Dehalococcoidales bacterium]|nr:MAG: hypothetical protein JSU58_02320 [Dehalococcoidales bacterium]
MANDLSDTEPPIEEELHVYREKIVAERTFIFRCPDKAKINNIKLEFHLLKENSLTSILLIRK